jgi:hypothetical protein
MANINAKSSVESVFELCEFSEPRVQIDPLTRDFAKDFAGAHALYRTSVGAKNTAARAVNKKRAIRNFHHDSFEDAVFALGLRIEGTEGMKKGPIHKHVFPQAPSAYFKSVGVTPEHSLILKRAQAARTPAEIVAAAKKTEATLKEFMDAAKEHADALAVLSEAVLAAAEAKVALVAAVAALRGKLLTVFSTDTKKVERYFPETKKKVVKKEPKPKPATP